jgi:HK97 family phage prohead protease
MAREFKQFAVDETERGTFSGWASRFNEVDTYNDMVMAGAYDNTVRERGGEIVILSDHDITKSVGRGRLSLRPSWQPEGLWVDVKLALELQDARDAYIRMRDLGKSGLSIGYETVRERMNKGVRELHEIKLFEVSIVEIPALDSARILAVKSRHDDAARALASFLADVRDTTLALKAAQVKSKMQEVASLIRQGRKHTASALMIEVEHALKRLSNG